LKKKSPPKKKAGKPAFIAEFVGVQGVGFRCMAYRDKEGKWWNAEYNDELLALARDLRCSTVTHSLTR
jgi:hypothetical protein